MKNMEQTDTLVNAKVEPDTKRSERRKGLERTIVFILTLTAASGMSP